MALRPDSAEATPAVTAFLRHVAWISAQVEKCLNTLTAEASNHNRERTFLDKKNRISILLDGGVNILV